MKASNCNVSLYYYLSLEKKLCDVHEEKNHNDRSHGIMEIWNLFIRFICLQAYKIGGDCELIRYLHDIVKDMKLFTDII